MWEKYNVEFYIDIWSEFTQNDGYPKRSLYDTNNHNGIHVNINGISVIIEITIDYLFSECDSAYLTPRKKKSKMCQKLNIYTSWFGWKTAAENTQIRVILFKHVWLLTFIIIALCFLYH